ncbi:hypothetical protein RNZ50_15910 [Paracoccaceae bacterium Fryx2]|nr:hypothetical protein [Paracoccaceae bacterium Fryx2]
MNGLCTSRTPATALATLGAAFGAHVARTAATTVTLADRGRLIDASGTWTLALPTAATAGAGFSFALRNAGAGVITIDPAGAELIDGAATLALATGRSAVILCTGTAWLAVEIPGKVTATAVDATPGRLLKVGDFGLGSDYGPPISDFTAELRSGFWRFLEASATGYPTGSSYFGGAFVARCGGSEAGSEGGHLVIAARVGASPSSQRVQLGTRQTDTGAMGWAELVHVGMTPTFPAMLASAGITAGTTVTAGTSVTAGTTVTVGTALVSTAGALTLGGNPVGGKQMIVADDAVGVYTLPKKAGTAMITGGGTGTNPLPANTCRIVFTAGSSQTATRESISGFGASIDVVAGADLTATPGTDGRITVSVRNGEIQINNRLGFAANFEITVI